MHTAHTHSYARVYIPPRRSPPQSPFPHKYPVTLSAHTAEGLFNAPFSFSPGIPGERHSPYQGTLHAYTPRRIYTLRPVRRETPGHGHAGTRRTREPRTQEEHRGRNPAGERGIFPYGTRHAPGRHAGSTPHPRASGKRRPPAQNTRGTEKTHPENTGTLPARSARKKTHPAGTPSLPRTPPRHRERTAQEHAARTRGIPAARTPPDGKPRAREKRAEKHGEPAPGEAGRQGRGTRGRPCPRARGTERNAGRLRGGHGKPFPAGKPCPFRCFSGSFSRETYAAAGDAAGKRGRRTRGDGAGGGRTGHPENAGDGTAPRGRGAGGNVRGKWDCAAQGEAPQETGTRGRRQGKQDGRAGAPADDPVRGHGARNGTPAARGGRILCGTRRENGVRGKRETVRRRCARRGREHPGKAGRCGAPGAAGDGRTPVFRSSVFSESFPGRKTETARRRRKQGKRKPSPGEAGQGHPRTTPSAVREQAHCKTGSADAGEREHLKRSGNARGYRNADIVLKRYRFMPVKATRNSGTGSGQRRKKYMFR